MSRTRYMAGYNRGASGQRIWVREPAMQDGVQTVFDANGCHRERDQSHQKKLQNTRALSRGLTCNVFRAATSRLPRVSRGFEIFFQILHPILPDVSKRILRICLLPPWSRDGVEGRDLSLSVVPPRQDGQKFPGEFPTASGFDFYPWASKGDRCPQFTKMDYQ